METNICPKTWLAESILVTIFCCLPFGIVGIVNASKVSALYAQGRYSEAEMRSVNAKKWVKVAFVIGIIWIVISLIANASYLFSIFG